MHKKCCVENCSSKRQDVNLYRFPKNEIGLREWLVRINSERLRSLSVNDLHKHFVCQKHFEKRFFRSTIVRSRLRYGAYPTLFDSKEINSGIPETYIEADTAKNKHNEHNYCKKRQYHEDHTYCKNEVAEKRARNEINMSVSPFSTNTEIVMPVKLPSASSSGNEPAERAITRDMSVSPFSTNTEILEPDSLPSASAITRDTAITSTPKSRSTQRKRVIATKKSLTPNCSRLYSEYAKSQKQLKFSNRARRAMKFSKSSTFEKLTENINPLAKKIIWMQIKQSTKKTKGRRFTNDEKLIALSIMKQSPKCYKFLHKIFILPSKYTLNKMIAELDIEAGINPQVFEAVKKEVNTWEENKKYCSILFDEVALESSITYDKHKDKIDGFVELNAKKNDFADHALVFMLRGAIHKWQQPLTFYFCKGATSGVELKNIIKEIVVAVGNTGLLPIALACDQGTAFQSAIKSLQEDTRREQIIANERIDDVIVIDGHTLSVIYDPPHLIKGLRNNFLTKNIKYKGKIAKWNDIVEVYKTDCNHAEMRLLHKLNDEHVIPEKIKKMKVKNCARVFSKTVAATLSYTAQFSHYSDGNKVSPTLQNTAEIVSFFDDLFDSVNGASLHGKKTRGKPLRQAVTETSKHHTFWDEAIRTLKDIRFIDNSGKETTVPSLKNWLTTLTSYQRLWQFFKTKSVKIIRPRYFNSDPIENFFGQVRAYNFRNNDPDCHSFKCTFRSLLITRFIKFHNESYNCEEDSGEQLLKLKALFEVNKSSKSVGEEFNVPGPSDFRSTKLDTDLKSASQERLCVHSRAYTAGWVIRKIKDKINCLQCNANLVSNETNFEKNSTNNWISFKEFKSVKDKKLAYPTDKAVRFFGIINIEGNKFLENRPQQSNILKEIKNKIKSKYSFDFLDCTLHREIVLDFFIEISLRLTIFNWCNVVNHILKGTDVLRLQNKCLPYMQQKAFNKYKTKLKNKRINK